MGVHWAPGIAIPVAMEYDGLLGDPALGGICNTYRVGVLPRQLNMIPYH